VVPVVLVEPSSLSSETKVAVIQFMVGATGARLGADGNDGRDPGLSSMANNPTEIIEREASITVLEYGVRLDSGGAGTFRGGCGQRYRFRVEKDGCTLLARGIERMRFRPWGLGGGMPGERFKILLERPCESRRELAKFETLELDRGDVVEILMPGGGGFGSPLARDPGRVLRDVELGFVSARAARRIYGVIIRQGRLAGEATAILRASMRRKDERHPRPEFDFGPERREWERCFTDRDQTDIAAILSPLPRISRNNARNTLLRDIAPSLADVMARGQPLDRLLKRVTQRDVRRAIRKLTSAAKGREKRHG
jgi:N-methylhydantoinase B